MAFLGIVAAGGIGAYGLFMSSLLCVELWASEAWYFPGDPAYPEVGVIVGAISLGAAAAIFVLARLLAWTQQRPVRLAAVTAIGLAGASLVPPLSCIAQRHFGEWGRLRVVVWQEIERARADGAGVRQFQPPIEFRFAGQPEPVRIRGINATRWPSMLIDFGNGRNASFDLRTMLCDYSD